jgi:hypothetical protein
MFLDPLPDHFRQHRKVSVVVGVRPQSIEIFDRLSAPKPGGDRMAPIHTLQVPFGRRGVGIIFCPLAGVRNKIGQQTADLIIGGLLEKTAQVIGL